MLEIDLPLTKQDCIAFCEQFQPLLDTNQAKVHAAGWPVDWLPVATNRLNWTRLCVKGNHHMGYQVYVEFYDAELDSFEHLPINKAFKLD